MTNPYCNKCKGTGSYEGPWYGDFEPKILKLNCECGSTKVPPTMGEITVLAIGFVVLFILLLSGGAH